MSLTVEINPVLRNLNRSFIKHSIKNVIEKEGYLIGEISIVIGSDELLRKLKKKYFKKDHFTDVISFRLNNYEERKVEGEIYISQPRAAENALIYKEPIARELTRLIIHGGLHLLNYDDQTTKDKATMTQKENEYLELLPWEKLISAEK